MRRSRRAIDCAVLEALEARRLLAFTYYVSPSGNDTNTGTSASAPFKTLAKINALNLEPGDQVLLEGGQTFASALGAANIARDSGFEAKSTSIWNENFDATAGNTTFSTNSSDVHSGSVGLRVGGSSTGGRGQTITPLVKPSQQYFLRAWAKRSSGTGDGYLGITFKHLGVEVAKVSLQVSGSSWREYRAAIVAPELFDHADIWFVKLGGTSVLSVDDVSLNEVSGGLVLDASDAGTSASPVTIGSYGTGQATIAAGDTTGISLINAEHVRIEDLVLSGTWNGLSGSGGNAGYGIVLRNTLASNAKLDSILVDNIQAAGFKYGGIVALGERGKAGFTNLRISNSAAHDNGEVGIEVRGMFDPQSTTWAHGNVYIGWCRTYNNGGLPGVSSNTGSGIKVGDVSGGTIERSVAYNNGQLCDFAGGGPVGIWCWDSNALVIQHNESYGNRTGSGGVDGGGFDLDGGCTNCIMQYNYAHDNDGAGYLLWQFDGARPFSGNIVRYNISQNDARNHEYGAIYMGGASNLTGTLIHNNTIFLSPSGNSTIAAIKIVDTTSGTTIRNNIFITTGGVRIVYASANYPLGSVQFAHNGYYSSGSGFVIRWAGANYSSLSAWRSATGQEKNGSIATGLSVNPMLVNAGGGGTIGDAARLHTLTAYQLLAGSPMIGAGIAQGGSTTDFYGAPATGADLGAFDWTVPTISGTAGDDLFTVRTGGAGSAIEVFANAATTGAPTAVWTSGVYDSLTINVGDGNDVVNWSVPAMTLHYAGSGGTDAINVNGGTCIIATDAGALTADLAVSVAAGASVMFNVSQHIRTLNISGTATMAAGLRGRLTAKSLSIAAAGRLDLNDSELILDYDADSSPFDLIRGMILQGYSDMPDPARTGITSTVSQNSGGKRILVLLDNADYGVSEWNGQTVDGTTLVSRFTYFGDLNLDGMVSGDDLAVIDSNLGTAPAPSIGWLSGDANMDGLVTGDDYATVDSNLGLGT